VKSEVFGGLFLLVTPAGGKLWNFKYRFEGKEKKLAFGAYHDISLAEARQKRDQARNLLANEADPGVIKKYRRRQVSRKRKLSRLLPANGIPSFLPPGLIVTPPRSSAVLYSIDNEAD
jgi:hypothetical protein